MKFSKVYLEITNVCALKCDFCPPKTRAARQMSLELFEKCAKELKNKTRRLALHVMGDPLLVKNLREYLDIAQLYSHKIELTTSGFYLKMHDKSTLNHSAITQLNISLNSFNKNHKKMSLDEYLGDIFALIEHKSNEKQFINLRLWNLKSAFGQSEREFNDAVLERLERRFGLKGVENFKAKESFRVARHVRVHFDEIFEWASLKNELYPPSPCHGISRQIGILSDGSVVPCCLDFEAKVLLGDANLKSLRHIVSDAKQKADALKNGAPTEELCRRCSYRLRFKE